MATLQVRDLPDHIHRELARQAEKERRSLAQQAIVVLEKGLQAGSDNKARRRAALERSRRIDPTLTAHMRASVDLIREDRNR